MPQAQIALNRFGLGAKAGEAPPGDGKHWLLDQFSRYDPAPPAIAALPRSPAMVAQLAALRLERRDRKDEKAEAAKMEPEAGMGKVNPNPEANLYKPLREAYVQAAGVRMAVAGTSDTPFVERLVAFWSNHFAVSVDKVAVIGLAAPFENEAIRPNVLGKFSELLFAAVRHPAMLLYLDQAQSIGPDSQIAEFAARRGAQRQPGLNENLAREIMELHTLGARSGYSQNDVTEFARAMTGLTVSGLGRLARLAPSAEPGKPIFVEQMHQPGARQVMGKRYDQQGERQLLTILSDLASHPATARHIAIKLARHFASDDPLPALVARLETAFLKSGGDLPVVYRALIEAPEVWAASAPKFRPPWDWLVALRRATGVEFPAQQTAFVLNQLGQPTWRPGSPAGWDDVAASWAAPDALLRRVEFANRFAQRVATLDARQLGPTLFPDALSEPTKQAVARADSPAQALSLLFVAPEMLRR